MDARGKKNEYIYLKLNKENISKQWYWKSICIIMYLIEALKMTLLSITGSFEHQKEVIRLSKDWANF